MGLKAASLIEKSSIQISEVSPSMSKLGGPEIPPPNSMRTPKWSRESIWKFSKTLRRAQSGLERPVGGERLRITLSGCHCVPLTSKKGHRYEQMHHKQRLMPKDLLGTRYTFLWWICGGQRSRMRYPFVYHGLTPKFSQNSETSLEEGGKNWINQV